MLRVQFMVLLLSAAAIGIAAYHHDHLSTSSIFRGSELPDVFHINGIAADGTGRNAWWLAMSIAVRTNLSSSVAGNSCDWLLDFNTTTITARCNVLLDITLQVLHQGKVDAVACLGEPAVVDWGMACREVSSCSASDTLSLKGIISTPFLFDASDCVERFLLSRSIQGLLRNTSHLSVNHCRFSNHSCESVVLGENMTFSSVYAWESLHSFSDETAGGVLRAGSYCDAASAETGLRVDVIGQSIGQQLRVSRQRDVVAGREACGVGPVVRMTPQLHELAVGTVSASSDTCSVSASANAVDVSEEHAAPKSWWPSCFAQALCEQGAADGCDRIRWFHVPRSESLWVLRYSNTTGGASITTLKPCVSRLSASSSHLVRQFSQTYCGGYGALPYVQLRIASVSADPVLASACGARFNAPCIASAVNSSVTVEANGYRVTCDAIAVMFGQPDARTNESQLNFMDNMSTAPFPQPSVCVARAFSSAGRSPWYTVLYDWNVDQLWISVPIGAFPLTPCWVRGWGV